MKKVISLITVFLACVVAACTVCFAGCSSNDDPYVHFLDLSQYEIGDEIPSYPNCQFDYKINEDCTVHINKITTTLSRKDVVSENDTMEGEYHPYSIKIVIDGTADPSFSGTRLQITAICFPTNGTPCSYATIEEDGSFYCEIEINIYEIVETYLYSIIIVSN